MCTPIIVYFKKSNKIKLFITLLIWLDLSVYDDVFKCSRYLSGPWYLIILYCASYFSVGGSEWLLDSVLHLSLTPRRRRRLLSYEMRVWPANTGTSTTPMIIQFFIISFYIISDMIEGLPSDNNVDLSFWQAACSGHLRCQRLMDPSKSVMRYVCECLCVGRSCQHALVSKSPLDQLRSVEN